MQQNAATFSVSEVPSDGKSNGDGAEWIRKGVEYFPNAEFQGQRPEGCPWRWPS